MVWRALSVAFSLSLLVWSLWLLYRGSEAAGKVSGKRAAFLAFLAVACIAVPVAALIAVGSGAPACT
jgi:hypothetical protein